MRYLLVIGIITCAVTVYLWPKEPVDEPNLAGPQPTWEEFIVDIEAEQEALMARYGDYIQVTEDGRLMYKDQIINENRFKNKIPPNTEITVYETKNGKGIIVTQTYTSGTTTRIRSFATGPLAGNYTFDRQKQITPQIIDGITPNIP